MATIIVRDDRGRFVKGHYAGFGFKKGHTSWLKGKHLSLEHRLKDSESHRKLSPIKSFTEEERDVIIGSLLGDGSIKNTATRLYYSCYFREGHMLKQEKYLVYKAEILKRFNARLRLNKNKDYLSVFLETSVHPLFTELHRRWYLNGRKVFREENVKGVGPLGLAIWYQDDGSIWDGHPSIATCNFNFGEHQRIVSWLEDSFDLIPHIHKAGSNHFRLWFSNRDKDRFFNLVRDKIHQDIRYKLPRGD